MLREEKIVIGTITEIVDYVNKNFIISPTKFIAPLEDKLEDQLETILFTGALTDEGAMGMIFFMSEVNTTGNDGIPESTLTLTSLHVHVLSDNESKRREEEIEKMERYAKA